MLKSVKFDRKLINSTRKNFRKKSLDLADSRNLTKLVVMWSKLRMRRFLHMKQVYSDYCIPKTMQNCERVSVDSPKYRSQSGM
jgi:hypothetical protein